MFVVHLFCVACLYTIDSYILFCVCILLIHFCTTDCNKAKNVFCSCRKSVHYHLGWNKNLDEYSVAIAPYGGPIGKTQYAHKYGST